MGWIIALISVALIACAGFIFAKKDKLKGLENSPKPDNQQSLLQWWSFITVAS